MSTVRSAPSVATPDARTPAATTAAGVGLTVLLTLLALRTALILVGDGVTYGLVRAFSDRPDAWPFSLLFANVHVVVLADVVSVALVAWLVRREGLTLRDLVRPAGVGRDLLLGLAVFALLVVAFGLASFGANLVVFGGAPPVGPPLTPPLWLGIWSIVVLPVTVAVAEQLLYRGYVQPRLAARIGRWPALLVVAGAFGLQHAGFALTSLRDVAARVLAAAVVGVVFGVLYLRLKRLVPLIVGHWLLDVLGLGVPMLLAALAVR